MSLPIQPIYLLADSQLLFLRGEDGPSLLESVRREIEKDEPKAAYIGASNDDAPEFYAIFEAAMDAIGITERRLISKRYSAMDHLFLNDADLILLAGGDVTTGWNAIVSTGMRETIIQRYYGGAVLFGVSAGAIQLGLSGWREKAPGDYQIYDTFKLIPHLVDVHAEDTEWLRLKLLVATAGSYVKGLGIPRGGGLIYHPDHTLEPVRHPVYEISAAGEETAVSLLIPGERRATEVEPEERQAAPSGNG